MKKAILSTVTVITLLSAGVIFHRWNDWFLFPEKRAAILRALRDSSSAQFRDERFSEKTGYICGQINAKNGMGGYTGFKRYASSALDFILEDSGLLASQNTKEKTTQEIIEQLDREINFMKANGRKATAEELLYVEFEVKWKRLCT